MKTKNVVIAAAAGTAAMTMFSYFLSGKKDKEFKEPKLLGKLVSRAVPSIGKTPAEIAGWLMHGSMGVMFASAYKLLLERQQLRPDLPNDVAIGVANGVAGVVIWKLVFSLHPNPPKIHFSSFYRHLILAHIVFAIVTLYVLEGKTQPENWSVPSST